MRSILGFSLLVLSVLYSSHTLSAIVKNEAAGPEFIDGKTAPSYLSKTALAYVEACNNRDKQALSSIINYTKIAKSAATGLFDSLRDEKAFAKGLESGKSEVLDLYLDQLTRFEGSVILLGYVKREGKILPQLRIDLGDYGIDYIELYINRVDKATGEIVDWYQLSTDQTVSQSLGSVGRLMTNPSKNILKKLFGMTSLDQSTIKTVKEIGKARLAGEFLKANRYFDKLPEKIRFSQTMLNLGISIASSSNDEALYKKRLSQLAKYHADSPSAAFLLVDHYFYLGDLKKALNNIKVMERKIGKDGFTTYLKANLYYALGNDPQMAKALYKDAIKLEPSMEDSYQTLAALYIDEKNYPEAVKVMSQLEQEYAFQFLPDDFEDTPENKGFKQSDVFKRWMSRN